jgi:DNA-binding NarL/FixJ family response regulator
MPYPTGKVKDLLMAESIRVLLADDHPLVRAGIRATLGTLEALTLVGEASDGHETQRLCRELKPDVLLLDLNMPGPPPVDTLINLSRHCPETKIIILTAYDDAIYLRSVVTVGVAGYVLKDEAPEALVRAIQTVMKGDTWFSRPLLEKLAVDQGEPLNAKADALSRRDWQLLHMLGQGWDNARIAAELNLAEQTIRNYVSRLYVKLSVSSRAEAIVWILEHADSSPFKR